MALTFINKKYIIFAVLILCGFQNLFAQNDSLSTIRSRGKQMAETVERILKDRYYDPNFHGVNIKEKFAEAREQIKKAQSNAEVYTIIAKVLVLLDDSHTTFFPPRYTKVIDYGFKAQMIGDVCYVTAVKKGSDAEAKGVKIGDVIISFHDFTPTRQSFWQIDYIFNILNPQSSLRVKLKSPTREEKSLVINSLIRELKDVDTEKEKRKEINSICKELNAETAVCQLRTFAVSPSKISQMMSVVKDKQSLILDLRGNSGGYVVSLKNLIGHFFKRKVKIGLVTKRGGQDEEFAEPVNPKNYFGGRLSVLIDSESASASEVFARVIQLEKRGTVIGDKSAGQVMTSRFYGDFFVQGTYYQNITLFLVNVTVSDLIMNDGKSLERIGVSPDTLIIPSAFSLVNQQDYTLSLAAREFGYKLSPAEAKKIFPSDDETEKVINAKEASKEN